jgi:hypothetical protein
MRGKTVHLAILRDGFRYQVFNATNDSIAHHPSSSTEFLKRVCAQIPLKRELGHFEVPMSKRKIKELLGFEANSSVAEVLLIVVVDCCGTWCQCYSFKELR